MRREGVHHEASHAIFVREGATRSASFVDAVPPALRARTLSVRGFDARGMLTDADLVAGPELEGLVARLFAEPQTAYLHAHCAKPGSFAARIDRVLV